ncbi:hypothetical protein GCWU000325_02243 [Alloprevotella tannerae ATCC 51259]|uniref:Uncharacterized protein n=1 Tax=Alloprevotella tannerae ATCC 51259 TaxID=626522 RepID=C9LJ32_9BACT|nr:hypothetical protein GCWU000325_02243 [Alloprevotella tannerae ATCC 51259]
MNKKGAGGLATAKGGCKPAKRGRKVGLLPIVADGRWTGGFRHKILKRWER